MYIFKVSLKQQQSNVKDDISIHLILQNPNGGGTMQVINIGPATFHCCDLVSFKVAESQSITPRLVSLCA